MTTKRFILLTLISALVVLLSLSAVYAQDATATPGGDATEEGTGDTEATEQGTDNQQDNQQGQTDTEGMVTCDSDLILLLYVAERFFDFDTFAGQMSSQMNFDVATINRGQYAPWFNQMEQSSNVQMSDEFNTSMMNMMTMSDADFEANMNDMMASGDMANMSMLNVHDVADEPQECAALRRTLRRFFTALAVNESQIGGVNFGDQTGTTGATDTSSTDTDTETGDTSGTGDTTGSGDTDTAAGAITVNLTGAEEVPGPGDTDASGTSTVYLRTNTNEVCVDISIDGGMVLPATAAHIHQAPRGEAGPPVVPLNAPNENGLSSTCVVIEEALMQEMVNNPGNFYVNVHNEEFPEGAVRGQIR